MGRYDPYREPSLGDRLVGWLLGALLGLVALSLLVGGAQWLWRYFTSP